MKSKGLARLGTTFAAAGWRVGFRQERGVGADIRSSMRSERIVLLATRRIPRVERNDRRSIDSRNTRDTARSLARCCRPSTESPLKRVSSDADNRRRKQNPRPRLLCPETHRLALSTRRRRIRCEIHYLRMFFAPCGRLPPISFPHELTRVSPDVTSI
jgi:hypothetical protein